MDNAKFLHARIKGMLFETKLKDEIPKPPNLRERLALKVRKSLFGV